MPDKYSVSGRSSTITAAVWKSIMPYKNPTIDQVEENLKALGMSTEHSYCAYCGDKWTSWDHLFSVVVDSVYTGFFTDIFNLVPACSTCNSSKGNSEWREWMTNGSEKSPRYRITASKLSKLVENLDAFELKFKPSERSIDVLEFDKEIASLISKKEGIIAQMNDIQKDCNEVQDKFRKAYKARFEL